MEEESGTTGAWYFITETNVIKNLDRMPIHHKIKPQERKRIKRTIRRSRTEKDKPTRGSENFPENKTNVHKSRQFLLSESDSITECAKDDDDLDENYHRSFQRMGDNAYLSACRHCKVKPRDAILHGLVEENLSLIGIRLTAAEVEPLAYALMTNSRVKKLNLSNNCIESQGFLDILKMLEENRTISTLNLSYSCIENIILRKLFIFLGNNRSLVELNLEENQLNDDDAEVLTDILQENTTLTSLNLSHNCFRRKAGIAISNVLVKNKSLTNLNLSWNSIRKEGAAAIADGLKENRSLLNLNVSWNGFSNDGCEPFRNSLETNSTLQELDLSSNRIGYEGSKHMASALSANSGLKILKINLNSILTWGAFEIVNAIHANKDTLLERLEMKGVAIMKNTKELLKNIREIRPSFVAEHDVIVLSDDPIH